VAEPVPGPEGSLCVDDERPPFCFVIVEGVVEISDELDEMRRWAARIGGRSMGCRAGRGVRVA